MYRKPGRLFIMYEPYYAPLPDVDAYLSRIGMQRKTPSDEVRDIIRDEFGLAVNRE